MACLKAAVNERCISLQELHDELTNRLPTGSLIIFLLDCCRDNPLKKGLKLNSFFDVKLAKLKISKEAHNVDMTETFVGYATETGKMADSGAARCRNLSPFTHALVESFRNAAVATLDIEELFKSVRQLVKKVAQGGMIPDTQSNFTKVFKFLQTLPPGLGERRDGGEGKGEGGGR